MHAVALCESCPPLYCPGATRPRKAHNRLTSNFRVASYCRRVDLMCVYARSYARTIVNAHQVSLAFMQSSCAHHAPHCTAQALRAEAATFAALVRSSSKETRPRAKGGRGVRYARSSDGLLPTRFGNSSEKLVHQIWAPGNANAPGGLLDHHVT